MGVVDIPRGLVRFMAGYGESTVGRKLVECDEDASSSPLAAFVKSSNGGG